MSDEPRVLIVGGRKGGRPRSAEPRAVVLSSLPASEYDQIAQLAIKHETSVSAVARKLMRIGLRQVSVIENPKT